RGGRQDLTRVRARRRGQSSPARCLRSCSWRGARPGRGGRQGQRNPPVYRPADRVEITDAVITADAWHAQRDHASYLHRRSACYLLIVQRNQPGLHAQAAALPWRDVPKACDKREHGHGRTGRRTLKVTAVAAGLAFPCAAQPTRIRRRHKLQGKWSRATCYAVTSLTLTQVTYAPARRHHPRPPGALRTGCTGPAAPASAKAALRSAPRPARASW